MSLRSVPVSVVVLSRDRLPYTKQCLQSMSQTHGDLEWIVVDNGSTDGSADFLTEWAPGAGAQLIVNYRDPGAAHARNQAIARAAGEFILFLDNDVVLHDPAWLQRILAHVHDQTDAIGGSPLLTFPGDSDLVQCAGGGVTPRGWIGLLQRGNHVEDVALSPREEAWAPAASLLLRRDALLSVGGFDEAFDPVALLEDVDLCYRLRSLGGQLLFCGDSRLHHYEGTTFQHLGADLRRRWIQHDEIIRNRWSSVIADGPHSEEADIAWIPVVKEYSDIRRPSVRVASPEEARTHDLSFFASATTLPPASELLRVGVIGCGPAATRGALPGFAPPGSPAAAKAVGFMDFGGARNVKVIAVVDVDVDVAYDAARTFGIRHAVVGTQGLLDRVPLDAVMICTPPQFQVDYAISALDRGCHVLLEKPAAISVGELDRLMLAHRGYPALMCQINLPWIYHPAISSVNRLVSDGAIGKVTSSTIVFEHGGPAQWSPSAAWYHEGPGSGVVADLGGHVLSVASAVLGVDVDAITLCGSSSDGASALATFDSIPVHVNVGWKAAVPRFSVRVEGTEGVVETDLVNAGGAPRCGVVHLTGWQRPSAEYPVSPMSNEPKSDPNTEGAYRAFVRTCLHGGQAPTEFDRVFRSLRTALAWAEAARGTYPRSALSG